MNFAKLVQKVSNRVAPQTWMPPGHYYSPIVEPGELTAADLYSGEGIEPAIDLKTGRQIQLASKFAAHMKRLPFAGNGRFQFENGFFDYADAIVLGCMMLEFRPRRIVEFGSGHSSCVMIDVSESAALGTHCTFVDPFPQRLHALLRPGDTFNIVASTAQKVDLSLIDALEANDILFIDSTHVSKTGSDVNFHLFTLLPRLKPGVLIHFHDILYPFEYPREWIFEQNRSWNEAYALRAFLMFNSRFEIVFFNHYIGTKYPEAVRQLSPYEKNPGGSLWLRKVED